MLKKMLYTTMAVLSVSSVLSADFIDKKDFPNDTLLKSTYGMNIEAVEKENGFLKIYAMDTRNPKSIRSTTLYKMSENSPMLAGQNIQFLVDGGNVPFKPTPVFIEEVKKQAIFTVGEGTEEYIVFTDPECPYCQKFEKQIHNLNKNVKLYVLLFPLSFHKDAMQMSSYILDAPKNERFARLASVADKNGEWTKYNKPLKTEEVKKQMLLAMKFGVAGTPSIFSSTGTKVEIGNFINTKIKQMPTTSINPQALTYFQGQGLAVNLNPESKLPKLMLFVDLEDKNSQKLISLKTNKITDKYNVSLVLFPRVSEMSSIKALDVYISGTESEKVKKIYKYMNGDSVSKERLNVINSKLSQPEESYKKVVRKIGVLAQAMKQLKLGDFPIAVSPNGKFQDITSFYK